MAALARLQTTRIAPKANRDEALASALTSSEGTESRACVTPDVSGSEVALSRAYVVFQ